MPIVLVLLTVTGVNRSTFWKLGLSADSSYGAAITELNAIPFLTNSDAHSPHPDKLGREFNRIRLQRRTPKDVLASIQKGAIEMNAGFFPEEGKYNRTACTRCYTSTRWSRRSDMHGGVRLMAGS